MPNRKASTAPSAWALQARTIARRVWGQLQEDNISVLAAAIGFYAFLSIFPALTAVVSLYGLFAQPSAVQQQIEQLRGLLPSEALALLSRWLQQLAHGQSATFGIGLIVSLVVSLWTASYATATMMTALDIAYEVPERRGIVRFYGSALLLTAGLVLFVMAAIALVALLPGIIDLLPLSTQSRNIAVLVRWPILVLITIFAVAVLYHYAPDRDDPGWEFASVGALIATGLLALGSYVFSLYVNQFATYDKTYGSLGAVAILLMWFWLGAYSVLTGAEFNSELVKAAAEARADRAIAPEP